MKTIRAFSRQIGFGCRLFSISPGKVLEFLNERLRLPLALMRDCLPVIFILFRFGVKLITKTHGQITSSQVGGSKITLDNPLTPSRPIKFLVNKVKN